jgi:hypothetical protein
MKTYQYYKIDSPRRDYLGKRFFKVDMNAWECIQVCVTTGDTKKGRGHTFGVYLISRLTFFSNYLAMGYAVPCSEKEYTKNLKDVLSMLI